MKTRSLYDFSPEDFRAIPLTADVLLDQDESLYDTNWIISADDLFGQMELPTNDYNPYQHQAARSLDSCGPPVRRSLQTTAPADHSSA